LPESLRRGPPSPGARINQAEKYQRNEKTQYMSEARLQEELEAVGRTAPRKPRQEKAAEGSLEPREKERA
jgi:hypothetical protein